MAVVLAEKEGPAGRIVLNRPEVLNAIDEEVFSEFDAHLKAFGADPSIRAIVITGRGRAFSTGADIRCFAARSAEDQRRFMERSHAMMDAIEATPKPVIAAVNGVAAGGGFEIVLACDLAIAARSAWVGLTEIRYGFLPGGGGTQRLPRTVSAAIAKRLIWSGELITAEQACALSLILKVVDDDGLATEVQALLSQFAEWSAEAIAEAKTLVQIASERPMVEGLRAEREANVRLLATSEATRAIEAFLNRKNKR